MPTRTGEAETSRGPKWHRRLETIIDTSARLFAQRGYHATGISELCEANELGKGALYHYIGSKEQLLTAIFDRVMDEVLNDTDRVHESVGTPTEKLTLLGEKLLATISRYPHHVWVSLHDFPALTGERATRIRARRRLFEQRIEDIIRAGIATGEFRAIDPRLATLAWLGMHNYAYRWLSSSLSFSATQVATTFADILVHGLADPAHGAE